VQLIWFRDTSAFSVNYTSMLKENMSTQDQDGGVESSTYERTSLTFIDVFAGCGGLSLGLMQAGWTGLFAVEKDKFAFETLKTNLLEREGGHRYQWPEWLPQQPICAMELLSMHSEQLASLSGEVDLMAGGPPCQGFSSAGRRKASDPRNALMDGYLNLVRKVRPRAVLIENVNGITVDFIDDSRDDGRINYAEKLVHELSKDYRVHWKMINVSDYGVPQGRVRFFLLGLRNDLQESLDPFEALVASRTQFLKSKGLLAKTTASAAISDLELARGSVIDCPDSKGFSAIAYGPARTNFQKLMRAGGEKTPDSSRLARHRPEIVKRFEQIIDTSHKDGRLNVSISRELRESFGLKKMALRVLDPDRPSPTITSMPDDLLHYREPRTLTVRENARLQSFPDWFQFRGKYTTGGELRRKEVPRFTQVANAVPPLMAEAIGKSVSAWLASSEPSPG
jgi:DNA (cytosine-5)-methyltransferase 1